MVRPQDKHSPPSREGAARYASSAARLPRNAAFALLSIGGGVVAIALAGGATLHSQFLVAPMALFVAGLGLFLWDTATRVSTAGMFVAARTGKIDSLCGMARRNPELVLSARDSDGHCVTHVLADMNEWRSLERLHRVLPLLIRERNAR